MKKSDLATIILIAGFSTIVAFLLANVLLGDPNEESVKVQYLDVISSNIAQPDRELFNAEAVNPTVEVHVGQCNNNETWDGEARQCINNETGSTTSTEEETEAESEEETETEEEEPNEPTPEE